MCSGTTHAGNLETVAALAETAAADGADLLALPEVAGLMNRDAAAAQRVVTPPDEDPFVLGCQALAAERGLWIHTGSSPVLAGDDRFLNQSALIDRSGRVRGRYTKIHLFDADIGTRVIRESKRFAPGADAVLAETPWGIWGLAICYDLRFPHLFRDYAKEGAALIFAPSAFTVPTGKAHWDVLLRARAIDTGAFIVAAAQAGQHEDGRATWGHSMIVDPWGAVAADLGGGAPKLTVVEIDLGAVEKTRRQIPSLANERSYAKRWI
ncbi:MAG: nitrilase-related carbon-nitrogen hydrolase, partial [Pseudomonadota bacterium]